MWSMVLTIVVGVLFFVISSWTNREFRVLQTTTEQYILCEKAATNLRDGSDYLTEQVRLYVMTGQQTYLDSYFEEAEHDALTDLLNLGSFEKLLNIYEKGDAPYALIIVDVDYFKSVNDTCGHSAGDATLKKISSLLYAAFRSIDHIFRIGGDEFAIIMVEMTSDLSYTIQEKVDAINQTLAQQDDGLPKVSLSVGVAFSDRPDPTGTIFQDADQALYHQKNNGRAGCSFYQK